MRALLIFCVTVFALAASNTARACSTSYEIRPGDSLSRIAQDKYRNAFRWTEIYEANQADIGPDPDRILVGSVLQLACDSPVEQQEVTAVDPQPQVEEFQPDVLDMLVIGALPPFVAEGGGLLVDVMREIARADPKQRDVRLTYLADMPPRNIGSDKSVWVIPVFRNTCGDSTKTPLCETLELSEPLIEVQTVLYSRVGQAPLADRAVDLAGRRICHASVWPVDALDAAGRNWVAEEVVTVQSEDTPRACFERLRDGLVTDVLTSDLTGRMFVEDAAFDGAIDPQGMILGLEKLYAAALPDGGEVAIINQELSDMRRDGRFSAIMAKHLSLKRTGF